MGIFDYLIDKESNLEPKSGLEYIYRLDEAWRIDKLESVPMKKDAIVTDVIRLPSGKYEFTCKETGERLTSTYGWSLAENTPENILKIDTYEREKIKFELHKKQLDKIRESIATLTDK